MERVQKESDSRDSANSKRMAQGESAQGNIASRLNASPLVIAQRKKLQSLFGGAAQLQEAEGEMLQGKLVADVRTSMASTDIQASQPVQLESASCGETTVEWSTNSLGGDTVGTKMTAKKLKRSSIGGHANLKGSPPAANQQATLMSFLPTNPKLPKPNKYIKGHLLNHNIGGPGKDFNMFPITASANGTHLSAVEKEVKNWVLGGNKVDYEVAVTCSDANFEQGKKAGWVTASFNCNATNLDTAASISQSIPSELGEKSVAEEIPVLDGIGGLGIFDATYNWAVELDDPTDMFWKVAEVIAGKKGVDKDHIAEVLISVVIYDDVTDISPAAVEAVTPILEYMKSSLNWKDELGF